VVLGRTPFDDGPHRHWCRPYSLVFLLSWFSSYRLGLTLNPSLVMLGRAAFDDGADRHRRRKPLSPLGQGARFYELSPQGGGGRADRQRDGIGPLSAAGPERIFSGDLYVCIYTYIDIDIDTDTDIDIDIYRYVLIYIFRYRYRYRYR